MTVWYTYFPPTEPNTCHLFKNRDLDGLQPVARGGQAAIALPLKEMRLAGLRRDFMAAVNGGDQSPVAWPTPTRPTFLGTMHILVA